MLLHGIQSVKNSFSSRIDLFDLYYVIELAGRTGKSRSATVRSLLEHALLSDDGPDLLTLAGSWKDVRPAEQIIREVTEGRCYNRRSEPVDL